MILHRWHRTRNKGNRGFTLTELAIVLGIAMSILGAIWYAVGNAHEAQHDIDAVTELQTIATNIATLYQGHSTFPAIPAACAALVNPGACAMIQAKAIPGIYVDAQNNLLADNPWSLGRIAGSLSGLDIYELGGNSFRVSFYNTSYRGCLSLLLGGTSCHIGQIACPYRAFTAYSGQSVTLAKNGANGDWATQNPVTHLPNMNTAIAEAMCSANSYPLGGDVEFEYSF